MTKHFTSALKSATAAAIAAVMMIGCIGCGQKTVSTITEVSTTGSETVPSIENKTISADESETDSTAEIETVPTTESETVPATESETVPTTESETVPATESETVPTTENETIPATESETVPTTESETIPATESETVPATESETVPPPESETIPTTESETVPTTESETVPATESETVPTTENETVPTDDSETIPAPPPETVPIIENEAAKSAPNPSAPVSPHTLGLKAMVAAPEYPEMFQCPNYDDTVDYHTYDSALQQWRAERWERYDQPQGYADSLTPFFRQSMEQFLSGDGNQVCSPVNLYLALAMLAETCNGSSRQQILELLGHDSIDTLRIQAKQVWNAHYCSDGQTTSVLGNSLWLDSDYTFKEEAVSALVDHYYASVFNGDLGTEEMDRQLSAWINSQTGGLLSEYTNEIALDPLTVFTLASTAYFSADWDDSFYEGFNTREVFHCDGFDLTTDFMNQSMTSQSYYWADDFSAVKLGLSGDHSMWLILPDVGMDTQDLLSRGDYYPMINDPQNWKNQTALTVNLSIPKFDVDSKQDLLSGLNAMGITDVFSEQNADFSSMTEEPLILGEASHAARVVIDEEGVIAAAYTMMLACGSSAPIEDEIDFRLDRPFLFVITGKDHLPLFAGVVVQP